MRTVPAAFADRLLQERADLRALISGCGRLAGDRIEVDLDAVQLVHPALCQALTSYHSRTSRLWAAMRSGVAGSGAYDVTRRTLTRHQQVTGKVGRRDLPEVFEILTQLPGLGEVLATATDGDPDCAALRSAVSDLGGVVLEDDGQSWAARIPLEGLVHWPAELGGVATANEVGRWVHLSVRRAAWRDRRVRRLAGVDVLVDELWSDPSRDLALLPPA